MNYINKSNINIEAGKKWNFKARKKPNNIIIKKVDINTK